MQPSSCLLVTPRAPRSARSLRYRDEKTFEPKFTYSGEKGPDHWHELGNGENSLCASGTHQSPIDLHAASAQHGSPTALTLQLHPYPNGTTMHNLGTTIEIPAHGTMREGNRTYHLVQFHFHTPSEHHLYGEYFPVEVHFVFQNPVDASRRALGFFVELCASQGCGEPLLESIFGVVGTVARPGMEASTGPLDFCRLVEHFKSNKIYRYSGSLTTPPCSEPIEWILSAAPVAIDAENFLLAKKVLGFNARPVQN
ncbi:carbonic anhydrase [Eremomyces bilateralis CBS 781.70]|uniref:Carbonic anhydrase n=1 Tax=Eremomyces bilateralis CBS 781.70 TaxID=1392243 RepID=A0A6G1G0B9_9PEZI|nr:carbonic anhydrase [Eremomyces bilateralis CBS 781.70]KAF1811557.1 carbonic anhydrase [Eremomyces bilateralis CBS 781.70]